MGLVAGVRKRGFNYRPGKRPWTEKEEEKKKSVEKNPNSERLHISVNHRIQNSTHFSAHDCRKCRDDGWKNKWKKMIISNMWTCRLKLACSSINICRYRRVLINCSGYRTVCVAVYGHSSLLEHFTQAYSLYLSRNVTHDYIYGSAFVHPTGSRWSFHPDKYLVLVDSFYNLPTLNCRLADFYNQNA